MDMDDVQTEEVKHNLYKQEGEFEDHLSSMATSGSQGIDLGDASNHMTQTAGLSAETIDRENERHGTDTMDIDEHDTLNVPEPEITVHVPIEQPMYEPTQEEIDAAALFDEHNRNEESSTPPVDAQFLADLEMAQMLQALENGAGDQFGIPYYDQDTAPELFECVCGDSFTYTLIFEGSAVLLPCNHARCISCLNENVRVGLESRRNFPPRCCTAIDLNDIVHYLTEDVLARWAEVQVEYEDIAPVYCAIKECSQYLTKDTLIEGAKWALCSKCNKKTCTGCLCLESAHQAGSNVCPERIDKMDKDLMQKEGWKACPHCGHMVERTDGCDHMTCECGQDFCYACGAKYRGGMPCNCDGQREWVEDDPNANDEQAQQQILDNIANQGAGHDQNTDADEGDEEEDEDEEDHESAQQETELHETNNEAAVTQNTQHQAETLPTIIEPPTVTDIDAITEFIARLRTTRQDLTTALGTLVMPDHPLLPQRLPGVAAELRRITGLSGEDFRIQLDEVRSELGQLAVAATGETIVTAP